MHRGRGVYAFLFASKIGGMIFRICQNLIVCRDGFDSLRRSLPDPKVSGNALEGQRTRATPTTRASTPRSFQAAACVYSNSKLEQIFYNF